MEQFDLDRYGFGDIAYGEMSMAISQDGRRVALADPSGLVTVDLRTNTFEKFDLPVEHAVALEWSADGATLFFKDRNARRGPCGPKGCSFDLTSQDLTAVPYDLFHATQGSGGQAFEVEGSTKSRPARVVTYQTGAATTAVELAYRTFPSTAGGPAADKYVAFSQCSNARKARDEGGVTVVDPSTGEVVAMLANDQVHGCQLGVQSWLTDRLLLVNDWLSGDVWLWDVQGKQASRVVRSRTTGLNVQVARDVAARRF